MNSADELLESIMDQFPEALPGRFVRSEPPRVVRVRELPPDLRAQVMAAMSVPDAAPQSARKRKPSMADAARLAAREGVEIRIAPDGTIIVTPVKPLDIAPDVTEPNEWDTVR
jgi:hypothetical protein